MKKGHIISLFCTLLLLAASGTAFAQPFDSSECASALDPVNCCDRAADEATRVETAREILKVGADDYLTVINYWAVDGSGEDGVGYDGAVYKEAVLTNFSRQEMFDYLDVIFGISPDMEMHIIEEVWITHPDDSMTYMATDQWYGTWEGSGAYVQPGSAVVKFRPGEGCASYQRDYFTEADTWWGVAPLQPMIAQFREQYILMFGLTDRCFDEDGDGYTKYSNSHGCANPGLDCNDYVAEINPAAEEVMGDGIDNNCDGLIDDALLPTCFISATAF